MRHAEMYLEDWKRLKGCCGVGKKFYAASLKDYPKEDAVSWRNILRKRRWIYVHGQLGTGKTHLLSALVQSRFIWGWDCWFSFVPQFLERLKRSFNGSSEEMTADLQHRAENCDLLALDDIGAEKTTEWTLQILTNIVNERYQKGLAAIFSSNLTVDDLAKRYSRLADRIRERALVVPLEERRPERG